MAKFRDIPGFDLWEHKSSNNLDSFFRIEIRARCFAAVLQVLNPTVNAVSGAYLRFSGDKRNEEPNADDKVNLSDFEFRQNRLRVKDLFFYDPDSDQLSPKLLTEIAEEILKYWEINVRNSFPGLEFKFGILEPNIDPEIYFFAERT